MQISLSHSYNNLIFQRAEKVIPVWESEEKESKWESVEEQQ